MADAVADAVADTELDSPAMRPSAVPQDAVLQVEQRDYTDLAPTDRPQAQSMRGFDPIYTDIVDYIVRCTHRIWDEKNPGLIYTHYTHNAVVYTPLGTSQTREEVVRATIQRIAEFPDRRGMAAQVIWGGDDRQGFYTSHLVTSVGRHTAPGPYGPPTGKIFYSRTLVDCMILENRIYREWLVRDNMAPLRQLGVDIDAAVNAIVAGQVARGVTAPALADAGRLLGQTQPEPTPDLSLASTDVEAQLLQALHTAWNLRMFGTLREVYASNVLWHGPSMLDLYGAPAAIQQALRLVAMIPDATWTPHHICSNPSNEGGVKVAVRWTMEGHHGGHGILGAPTGRPLFVMGMSHFHIVGGRVVEEYTLYDEVALRVQLKLPLAA